VVPDRFNWYRLRETLNKSVIWSVSRVLLLKKVPAMGAVLSLIALSSFVGPPLSDDLMKTLNLKPHTFHGEWNYTIAPSTVNVIA
jgi:hypothetical protein